jgi:hypothetical protein
VADQQVAAFRHASVPWRDDESLIALLAEMQSVPAFAERWSTHQLTDGDRSDLQLRHPEHGILTIHEEVLQLAGDNGQHLIVWMAADEATAAAFVEAAIPVVAGAPRLRVVSGS